MRQPCWQEWGNLVLSLVFPGFPRTFSAKSREHNPRRPNPVNPRYPAGTSGTGPPRPPGPAWNLRRAQHRHRTHGLPPLHHRHGLLGLRCREDRRVAADRGLRHSHRDPSGGVVAANPRDRISVRGRNPQATPRIQPSIFAVRRSSCFKSGFQKPRREPSPSARCIHAAIEYASC